jgi:hypothetical protein
MKGKKIILLSLALLLPICIFLFLKIFGKNQFDVPLLFQEGKIDVPSHCNLDLTAPYVLPDSIMNALASGNDAPLYILDFAETDLSRIREQFDKDQVEIKNASDLAQTQTDLNFLRDCIVLLKEPANIVLIDQRTIRGYYNGNKRDEIDRLLVEINIILKKY